MNDEDSHAAVTALHEGILAAYYTLQNEGENPFSDTFTLAQTALASLRSAGFEIVKRG